MWLEEQGISSISLNPDSVVATWQKLASTMSVAGGKRTWRLHAALLALWFAASFVVVFFARDLQFEVLGWPVELLVRGAGGGGGVHRHRGRVCLACQPQRPGNLGRASA